MALGILFLAGAIGEFGVRAIFRWRTWRDRGIATALVACALSAVFLTKGGMVVEDVFGRLLGSPGGVVLLPALSVILGLTGVNPFPFALLFGAIAPHPDLSLAMTLPLLVGTLPHTIFQLCTMPPREREGIEKAANPSVKRQGA